MELLHLSPLDAGHIQWTLRPATALDLDPIASLWQLGWLDAHLGHVPDALLAHRGLGDLRRMAAERLGETHVALSGTNLAGFCTLHGSELEQFYVASSARGSGVADALLKQAERLLAARFDTAWLAVVGGNARARRFYARHGWQERELFMNPARTAHGTFPVPALRYEKRLDG